MKKQQNKILLSGILALLLIGCSNGVNIKTGEDIKTKEETLKDFDLLGSGAVVADEDFEVSEVIPDGKFNGVFTVKKKDASGRAIKSKDKDGKAAKLFVDRNYIGKNNGKKDFLIESDAHLELVEKINITSKNLVNKGNLHFTSSAKDSILYLVPNDKGTLTNYGNIYAINDKRPKTVIIYGSYVAKDNAKIYLGLYVNKAKTISTDKINVIRGVTGETEVKFVFDKEEKDKIKDPNLLKDDYVIKATSVKKSEAKDAFKVSGGSVPVGNKVYELNHESLGESKNTDGEVFSLLNQWKLKEKK